MTPVKLRVVHGSSGWSVEALVPTSVNCAEFVLKADFQPIMGIQDDYWQRDSLQTLIGYEPWIQFKPKEWQDMIEQTLKEMVELWNEKHLKQ